MMVHIQISCVENSNSKVVWDSGIWNAVFPLILVGSELDWEINGVKEIILSNPMMRRIRKKKMPKLSGEEKVLVIVYWMHFPVCVCVCVCVFSPVSQMFKKKFLCRLSQPWVWDCRPVIDNLVCKSYGHQELHHTRWSESILRQVG